MPSKFSRRLNKRHDSLGLGNPKKRSKARATPTRRKNYRAKMGNLRTTSSSCKQRRTMEI
jgi:hypothetical protein